MQRSTRTVLLATILASLLSQGFGAAPLATLPQPLHQATGVPPLTPLKWNLSGIELVNNGGFESGNLQGWLAEGPGFGGWVADDGTLNPNGPEVPTPPLSGQFCANVNAFNFGNPVFVLSQSLSIPAGASAVTMRWQDLINNYANDGTYQDNHGVRVGIQSSTQQQLLFSTESGDPPFNPWTKRQFDISDFRGETVTIFFVLQLSQGNLNLHVDNVSILAEAPSLVTSDVYLGTTANLGAAELRGNTPGLSFTPTDLVPGTTYFWRIVTRFGTGTTAGPIWQFTTAPLGSLDHFAWNPVASPQSVGGPIPVTLTAKDVYNNTLTSFNGTANLSAASLTAGSSQHLLANEPYTALVNFDHSTVGYSFRPTTDLWVTGVRSYSGSKVSLWTDSGVLLFSRSVSHNSGVWTEAPLVLPVPLVAGRTYRLGVFGDGLVTQYARFDGLSTFAHGALLQSYQTLGDGFPNSEHPAQWWFVDLVYEAKSAQPQSINPDVSAAFINGVWSGAVNVGPLAGSTALRAHAGPATASLSGLFDLIAIADQDGDGMPDDWELAHGLNPNNGNDALTDADLDGVTNLDEYHAGTDPQDPASLLRLIAIAMEADGVHVTFEAAANRSYSILSAESPQSLNWSSAGHVDAGPAAGPVTVVVPLPGTSSRFYKAVTPRR